MTGVGRVGAAGISGTSAPTFRKDAATIVAAFTAAGHRVILSTKSHVSRDVAARLKGAGLDHLQVSIDGATSEIADFMTNSRGFFSPILNTIRNAQDVGISVRTNCVLTSCNTRSAPQLLVLLADLGVEVIRLTPYGLSPYTELAPTLFPARQDLSWLATEVMVFGRRYSNVDVQLGGVAAEAATARQREQQWHERSSCSAGRYGMIVLSDGKVILCDEVPVAAHFVVGDLTHQSLMDVWDSPALAHCVHPPQAKFGGTSCQRCAAFAECHQLKGRCFRDAWKAFGTFYAPAPTCPQAPPSRRLSV
ncbi:MAG: radical SAM protein [Vicinamibacterales bacterium]